MIKPVEVKYEVTTSDGEQLVGSIFTMPSEQLRDSLERLLNKLSKEELKELCLQVM